MYKMLKVYIASPYTIGDVEQNVRFQIDVADRLYDEGFIPFTPLLSHYHNLVHKRSYEEWLQADLEWLSICDIVLRLGGASVGADIEVNMAGIKDIPVVYSIDELLEKYS